MTLDFGLRDEELVSALIRTCNVPEIEALRAAVLSRIMPAFATINEEAEAFVLRQYEKLGMERGEDGDPAVCADEAQEQGMTYYGRLWGIQQGTLNLMAAALSHFVDQQMMVTLRHGLGALAGIKTPDVPDQDDFKTAMSKLGIALSEDEAWSALEELRLVGNVAKHGEGKSATKLRMRRPDLFIRPGSQEWGHEPPEFVERPLFGEDLFVSSEDLTKYFDAAHRFWETLATELERRTPQRSDLF